MLGHCLTTTLQPLMESWKGLLASGGTNSEFLKNDETTKNISFFVNVNQKMCQTIGSKYIAVFGNLIASLNS